MTKEKIYQIVKNTIVEILPGIQVEGIRIEESLKDIGANSIDRMDIVVRIIEIIGINIPLVEFAKVTNIQGLVDILYEKKMSGLK
ncbi:acyl carrier protein [Candidatus Desantisbacteria bacterium]|nr:acyl carrier protein [Candidatus Desantisbacteria bacterium]